MLKKRISGLFCMHRYEYEDDGHERDGAALHDMASHWSSMGDWRSFQRRDLCDDGGGGGGGGRGGGTVASLNICTHNT